MRRSRRGRRVRELLAVALGVACGPLLRDVLDALLGGTYPLFPYFVGTMISLVLAGPRAGLATLVLGFGLEIGLDGGAGARSAIRVAVYWAAGLVPIVLVRALGAARSRAAVFADEANARAGELRRWQALANTIIDSAPVGIGLYDKDCRFLRLNPALAAINGLSVDAHIGRRAWDVLPDLEPLARETFERVIATAEPVVGVEIEGRTPASEDQRYWRMSVYPVRAGQDPAFAVAAVVEEVTGQRDTVRRLRESEERYRSLVAASTAIVAVADAEGRMTAPQPSWEAYTGQPWEAYRGHGYLRALHPDDYQRAVAIWTAARGSGTVHEDSERLWHAPSGTYRHCQARVVPVRNPDGSLREWVSSIADVHEVVLAEEALRASEASFREMASLMPQSVWTATPDGRFDYYNQQWLDFVGMTLDEALARGWRHVVHPEDLARVEAAWAAALRDATPVEVDFRQRDRAGTYRWFLARGRPLRDERGAVRRWIGTSTDVDETVRAAEALRAERDLVTTVNRVSRALSAELDLEKLLHAIIEAITQLLGARAGAFVPADADAQRAVAVPATFAADAVRLAAADTAARAAGAPQSVLVAPLESPRSGEVGRFVFAHERPGAFDERDERLLEALAAQAAIAVDNARLYEAERRSRAEAEAANRAKDEFLSLLSHELRTPLTAVLSWVRLLREGRVKAERSDAALATVERSGWALTRIVDDLLDVSRIVTGRTRLEVRPVELGAVLETAAATIKPTADAKQVRLEVRTGRQDALVAGDPDRLQQVVWNLLANAVRFTPAGGSIELRLERDATSARIVVADSGAGIAPDLLPFVFDRFRQGRAASERQHGGLGLGLAIVRHLVELHGGTVQAESAGEGHGATFTVVLPVVARALAGLATGEAWG